MSTHAIQRCYDYQKFAQLIAFICISRSLQVNSAINMREKENTWRAEVSACKEGKDVNVFCLQTILLFFFLFSIDNFKKEITLRGYLNQQSFLSHSMHDNLK